MSPFVSRALDLRLINVYCSLEYASQGTTRCVRPCGKGVGGLGEAVAVGWKGGQSEGDEAEGEAQVEGRR